MVIQEHSWVFGVNKPGKYFPFIAQMMMKSSNLNELEALLTEELRAVASEVDRAQLSQVVESIIYYLPENPELWLDSLTEMIIVMPDGDLGGYMDRLGPPEGRNEEGIGKERSFPTPNSINPANRLDYHVSGWYEKYFINEVLDIVESNEILAGKLTPENEGRFIMGTSMGGGGSLRFALKYPEKFRAVASMSGAMGVMDTLPLNVLNEFFPVNIDVYGSAPLPLGTFS